MAWDAIDSTEIEVSDPVTNELMTKIKDNFDYLYGESATVGGTSGVANGSFEIDADGDGIPDSWTVTAYTGGACALDTVTPAHGAKGVKMTHPGGAGNGGGHYESGYIECSEKVADAISMIHWASAAGMKNQVIIRYFTAAKVDISSDETIYDSTANPTAETLIVMGFTPVATARFLKIRLVGGYTDTDVAGVAHFDRIELGGSELIRGLSADFTISEKISAEGPWGDRGSSAITIPVLNMPVLLVFPVEIKIHYTTGGYFDDPPTSPPAGYCRFRVGADYSEVIEANHGGYVEKVIHFHLSNLSAISQTIYLQTAKGTSAWVYAKKTTARAVVVGGAG